MAIRRLNGNEIDNVSRGFGINKEKKQISANGAKKHNVNGRKRNEYEIYGDFLKEHFGGILPENYVTEDDLWLYDDKYPTFEEYLAENYYVSVPIGRNHII